MEALFDEETIWKAFLKEEKEESREEGVSFGRMQEKKEMAVKLAKKGMSVAVIAEVAEVSVNTVRKWLSEMPVAAK